MILEDRTTPTYPVDVISKLCSLVTMGTPEALTVFGEVETCVQRRRLLRELHDGVEACKDLIGGDRPSLAELRSILEAIS